MAGPMAATPRDDTTSTLPSIEEAAMAESLAHDRPTIDAAVKSFISYKTAQSLTSNSTSTSALNNALILQVGRSILQAVNAYEFPIHDTVMDEWIKHKQQQKQGTATAKQQQILERSIVAKLWNGLKQSQQKPSRFLGRRALQCCWKELTVVEKLPARKKSSSDDSDDKDDGREQQLQWIAEFEIFLFHNKKEETAGSCDNDDDAALIWAIDGGQEELAKRRDRRLKDAAARKQVIE